MRLSGATVYVTGVGHTFTRAIRAGIRSWYLYPKSARGALPLARRRSPHRRAGDAQSRDMKPRFSPLMPPAPLPSAPLPSGSLPPAPLPPALRSLLLRCLLLRRLLLRCLLLRCLLLRCLLLGRQAPVRPSHPAALRCRCRPRRPCRSPADCCRWLRLLPPPAARQAKPFRKGR